MEFHVVYISDDNFASKLGTSLLSMFEHNLDLQIVVHILDMGIDALNKNGYNDCAPIIQQNAFGMKPWILRYNLKR